MMDLTIFGFAITWPLILGTLAAIIIGREILNMTYFWRHSIPAPAPLPFLGHVLSVRSGVHNFFLECQEKYGTIFGAYILGNHAICVGDPEMIKDICVRSFSKFINHQEFHLKSRPFNLGVGALRDQRWKEVRNVITPTFSGAKVKQMSPLMTESCDSLVRSFGETQDRDGEVNVCSLFEGFAMDAIAKCAFGLQVDSQQNPNDPFVTYAKSIASTGIASVKLILAGMIPPVAWLFNALDIGIMSASSKKFFVNVMEQAIKNRTTRQRQERKDLLQLLMEAHEDDSVDDESADEQEIHSLINDHHEASRFTSTKAPKKPLSTEEVLGQALFFLVAGFETTNTTLAFMAYSLATNPEVQEELVREIEQMAPTRESVTYATVSRMPYIDHVICETLRMYPPAAASDRVCNETHVCNGITILKGLQVVIPIFSIQRNPDLWPNPDEFDPTRFTKENREGRHPFAWMPFGAGPRNCVGMRFALMEVKMGIVRLLQNYRLEPSASTVIPIKLGNVTVKPEKGIYLRVVPRT